MEIDIDEVLKSEIGLDPEDWEENSKLGRLMMVDMMGYLQNIAQQSVWRPTTEESRSALNLPLPKSGRSLMDVYENFKKYILPYNKGNVHPRFWSWVQGTGTTTGMMAEMLGAGMNPNVAIGDHAAMYVDEQVIRWCKEMVGFSKEGSGILLSGGSMANITGILIARNNIPNIDIRKEGLTSLKGKKLILYASSEAHSCIQKAAEAIGIGSEGLHKIPVNKAFKMDITALETRIKEDLSNGDVPFCVVGNAGTVNTGAIDPLSEIQNLCEKYHLWFHVDGAFGALAKLSGYFDEELAAIETADSVAFDLHKWIYLPYEVGCLLVKDKNKHKASFALQPNYLLSHEKGLAAGPDPIGNYGLELSRGFKSLKVWMCFMEYGIDKFSRLIKQNIAQAYYLQRLILRHTDLELLCPVTMNIVNFRFLPPKEGIDANDLNKQILMELHERGIAAPSYTILDGKYCIRVAITNHRSRKSDFDALVDGVLLLGKVLIKS